MAGMRLLRAARLCAELFSSCLREETRTIPWARRLEGTVSSDAARNGGLVPNEIRGGVHRAILSFCQGAMRIPRYDRWAHKG
jgi:hypothetical protein